MSSIIGRLASRRGRVVSSLEVYFHVMRFSSFRDLRRGYLHAEAQVLVIASRLQLSAGKLITASLYVCHRELDAMQKQVEPTATTTELFPLSACYELVNVFELPLIRIHRFAKFALFTKQGLQWFNAFASAFNRPLLWLYTLSLPMDLVVLLAHEPIGTWFAVSKVLCQLPMLLLGACSLRIDMLQRLVWTYEFWFFSTMNVANCAAISVYFGDLRALSAISYWLAIQMNMCVDTNMQTHQVAGTSVLAILYQLGLLVTVSLQLTPHTHTRTLLWYRLHLMTTNGVLMNTVGTTAILMVRTTYHKRQNAKKINSFVVQCVSYRCRVKLQVKEGDDMLSRTDISTHSKSLSPRLSSVAAALSLQQLRFASQGTVFNDEDVVWPRAVRFLRSATGTVRRRKHVALYSTGILGLCAQPRAVHLEALRVHARAVRGAVGLWDRVSAGLRGDVRLLLQPAAVARTGALVRLLLPLGAPHGRAPVRVQPVHLGLALLVRVHQLVGRALGADAPQTGAAHALRHARRGLCGALHPARVARPDHVHTQQPCRTACAGRCACWAPRSSSVSYPSSSTAAGPCCSGPCGCSGAWPRAAARTTASSCRAASSSPPAPQRSTTRSRCATCWCCRTDERPGASSQPRARSNREACG